MILVCSSKLLCSLPPPSQTEAERAVRGRKKAHDLKLKAVMRHHSTLNMQRKKKFYDVTPIY